MVTKQQAMDETIKCFTDASNHTWKRAGQCLTYSGERNANKFVLKVRHGCYAHKYITETNANQFFIDTRQLPGR